MVNILVVDDNPNKLQNICKTIEPLVTDNVTVVKANDINAAKRELKTKNYDIMILDVYLPQTFGETPQNDGGMRLLREIKASKFYSYPRYVVSVSEYEDGTEEFIKSEGNVHTAIFYSETSNEWEKRIVDGVGVAISIVENTVVHRIHEYDVAVICALQEELELVKEFVQDVKKIEIDYDDDMYYNGFFEKDNKKISVVMSFANQKGMVAATSLATKMINNFSPKYMVMTGIAGGTKPDKMDFGDVIVASSTWDYRAGKDIRKEEEAKHLNSMSAISMDTKLISYCRTLAQDIDCLRKIKDDFKQGDAPSTDLKLLIGPVVSGASVVTDSEIVKDVLENQDRDVLAIEMEIYGMYYAANWAINPRPKFIAVKAISDFADSKKGDQYHKYASYTSAKIFEVLAKQYFEYGDA